MAKKLNLTNMFKQKESNRTKEMNRRELCGVTGGYNGEVKDRMSCCSDWCQISDGKTAEYRDFMEKPQL
ncbi:MAG: hypothetical protein GY765_11500 [bacterium]|nr:hypothetical protein [bacterium]